MFCKWCGMESASTDQCSWCHRSLTAKDAKSEETAPTETVEEQSTRKPPVSLRHARPLTELSAAAIVSDESVEEDDEPSVNIANARPVRNVAPAKPAPSLSSSQGAKTSMPIIGLKRPGGKGGGRAPAPIMAPVRPSSGVAAASGGDASVVNTAVSIPQNRTGTNSPSRSHVPAPGILPSVNRTGTVPSGGAARPNAPIPRSLQPVAQRGITLDKAREMGADVVDTSGLAAGQSAPRSAAPQTAAEMHVPELGTFTPSKSKYYAGQVIDPASGTHYDSATGQPTAPPVSMVKKKDIDDDLVVPPASQTLLIIRYFAVYACILMAAAFAAHSLPAYYSIPMIVALFLGGMLMPILRVAPWQRDDSDDVYIFVILLLIFGPVIGLFIFGVFGIMRQSANPAVVGCFIIGILAHITIMLAVQSSPLTLGPPWLQVGGHFSLMLFVLNWSALAAVAGWYCANFFHKLDE